ncbi:Prohibitin protein WPH, partial [Operophtera brumata]
MAAHLFNRIGQLGLGVAVVGGVVNSALYNGRFQGVKNLVVGEGTHFFIPWVQRPIIFDIRSRPRNVPTITGSKVDGGNRAVIFDRFQGVKNLVVGEGTHFFIPWVQRPIIFDIRSRPRNVPTITGSKDLQNVNITLRILFRPVPDQLPKIYTILGVDYDERVLPSITAEVLKAVVAQFDAGELITQRERSSQFGLILDDISITHLTFGKEFTQAVELKQVAQQDAEKARFLVEKAEQQKKAAVIAAEGDAQAAILLAKSFGVAGEGLVELRRIEAAEDIAYQLAKSRNI